MMSFLLGGNPSEMQKTETNKLQERFRREGISTLRDLGQNIAWLLEKLYG